MYRNGFKTVLDFIMAFIGFLLFLPAFILIALLLGIANKGNPFFFQKRPGKNEQIFTIIKFRTMSNARDDHGSLLPDDQRLTGVGKFVRATSLDEIPQFLNVLKGDMSVIGPRPLLPEYLEYYTDFQKQRNLVRPGITGYAQVHGRNAISWEEKFEHDVFYVNNMSLSLDLKILLKTIRKVISSENISPDGQAIMPKFSEYMQQKNATK